MKRYAVIKKHAGQTPLQALEVFRQTRLEYANVPLTYAGRLDPMAEGKLIILIGDECKKRKRYDGLDKEYEFEVLLGFKTDTGDVLGLAEPCGGVNVFSEKELKAAAKFFLGEHVLPYTVFSSKTVGGKPLFHYAIENNLDEIEIPTAAVRIYKMKFCSMREVSSRELIKNILAKIDLLQAGPPDSRTGSGFRKDEICTRWKSCKIEDSGQYTIATFKTTVSSGTYIRTLAPLIAEKLGTCGLAYSIRRAKIGRFVPVTKRFGFWMKIFV
ncbi:MAG: hypothetical protein Q7S86_03210 [bacterium]|nr:hypothetical protein [bacterium]